MLSVRVRRRTGDAGLHYTDGGAMDTFTAAQRSAVMRRVRSAGTGPEMAVRRMVHGLGYRYALHRSGLPGRPDLAFPCRKKVIFVHGCFWHGHYCRAGRNRPASNRDYWLPKLDRNKSRDRAHRRNLRAMGWKVLAVWECQLNRPERVRDRISKFLSAADS